jgi:aryl-alcohol dehydrogenase-like predicted oxidoreductase
LKGLTNTLILHHLEDDVNYRTLSGTDYPISELCFGTMRYADKSGAEDERSAAGARALEEAIDRGVNFIHSSYEYKTRWLTGTVLKGHPKRRELHHIIKVNTPDWDDSSFSAESFRRQVEEALLDLGTERIAVVQHLQRGVPRPDIMSAAGDSHRLEQFDEVSGGLAEIAETMRAEGKIDKVMSFPYTPAYAKRAVEAGVYDGLVAYFNLLETEMFELFGRLDELKKDFISIRPLCGGILSDRRTERDSLPEDDRMRGSGYDEFYRRLDVLRAAVGEPAMPWEQFAFRFSLAHRVIKSSVLGINTIGHLQTAAGPDTIARDMVERAVRANREFDAPG